MTGLLVFQVQPLLATRQRVGSFAFEEAVR